MRWIQLILFVVLFVSFAHSQKLKVSDASTKDALIGAVVSAKDQMVQGITDELGQVSLGLTSFPVTITIEYIGYKSQTIQIRDSSDVSVGLISTDAESVLNLVTVTASKYAVNVAKSPISIDVIKPELVRSTNVSSADKILNKVPGVQVLDGQANIRGGSGYSYGAGSRVMLLIDDMPALQSDAGFPNWNDIPIENLSQIEIVKGAASTLYGSAALNGIINYRTSYATSKPENRISLSGTYIGAPKDPDKKWWKDSLRYETNIAIVHKKKYGKLDVVGSLFANRLKSHNQFTTDKRLRMNGNLRYRFSDRLSLGINTIYNNTASNSFFLWKNPGSGAFQALPGTVSDRTAVRVYVDPTLTYLDKFNNKHRVLSRINYIDNKNNTNQSNTSLNQYVEYQFQRRFEKMDATLTAGLVHSQGKTDSQLLGDTTFMTLNQAVYAQFDKNFGEKLTVNAGVRYEYNQHKSPISVIDSTGVKSDGRWISRLSANYQLQEYTFLRGSYGQGYRFPTLTERFVTTTFGSFSIFSNPSLTPELGWSSEIGIKQGFSIGGFKGFLDGAVFWSEYDNMIEFTFVFDNSRLGFQPQNVGDTRIRGAEFGIFGQVQIGSVPINIFGGYTYIDPVYKNYNTSEQIRNSVSEPKNILKYRSKHLAKIDAEARFGSILFGEQSEKDRDLRLGISTQYASHVINIDKAFEAVPQLGNLDIFGVGTYRDFHNKGFALVDVRVSFHHGPFIITALVNNILNIEYSLRPALLESPRNFGLRFDYNF